MSQVFNLATLDGSNGFRVKSDSWLGTVKNLGDINGDGFDDIGVAGPDVYTAGQMYDTPSSYVIFGKSDGFNAILDPATLNGDNGFQFLLDDYAAGRFVNSAGDFNNDGIDDLLVEGDPYFANMGMVVFGKNTGFNNVEKLTAAINNNNALSFNGLGDEIESYNLISSAGDVNDDGMDDIIIGHPYLYDDPTGMAAVIFGDAEILKEILMSGTT